MISSAVISGIPFTSRRARVFTTKSFLGARSMKGNSAFASRTVCRGETAIALISSTPITCLMPSHPASPQKNQQGRNGGTEIRTLSFPVFSPFLRFSLLIFLLPAICPKALRDVGGFPAANVVTSLRPDFSSGRGRGRGRGRGEKLRPSVLR
jgi:hypothetical protein